MPVKYACMTRSGKLVAEHPPAEQPKLAATLQKLLSGQNPREYRREIVQDNDVSYHILCTGSGDVIGCVTTSNVPSRVVFRMLDEIEPIVSSSSADIRNARKVLQQKIDFYNDPQNDKITSIIGTVAKAQDQMTIVIDQALERGKHLEGMSGKSQALADQAKKMEERSTELKRQFWWKNMRVLGAIGLVLLAIVIVIVLSACNPNFSAC